ncbi:hypothetical protein CRUP_033973 [Coryphaenoides rupestris]|nr:hypothetical protein CRUP_033973 [Coryphaenoides rupestris]
MGAAELDQLEYDLQEMDPENAMLPAGFRQRDQTKKTPTGDYDRDALQDYLEKSALELEDREDLVPFTREKKAILGMYTLMSNKQYYDALGCTGKIANTEGINSVVKADPFKIFPEEPPNTTNVEETVERIHNNDSGLMEVNLNNIKVVRASP